MIPLPKADEVKSILSGPTVEIIIFLVGINGFREAIHVFFGKIIKNEKFSSYVSDFVVLLLLIFSILVLFDKYKSYFDLIPFSRIAIIVILLFRIFSFSVVYRQTKLSSGVWLYNRVMKSLRVVARIFITEIQVGVLGGIAAFLIVVIVFGSDQMFGSKIFSGFRDARDGSVFLPADEITTLTLICVSICAVLADVIVRKAKIIERAIIIKDNYKFLALSIFLIAPVSIICGPLLTLTFGTPAYYFEERAISYAKHQEFFRSIEDINEAIRRESKNNSRLMVLRTTMNFKIGNMKKTIDDESMLIDTGEQLNIAYVLRGAAKIAGGSCEDALMDFDKAIEVGAGGYAFGFRGICLGLKAQKNEEIFMAGKECDKAIKLGATEELFYRCRGTASLRLGQTDAAVADFTEGIGLEPRLWNSYYLRGLARGQNNQCEAALADFFSAQDLSPNDSLIRIMRSNCELELGRGKDALEDCDKAIAISPRADAFRCRARVHARFQKFDDAISDLDHAISVDVTDDESFFMRGNLLRSKSLNDRDGCLSAVADYSEAIKLDDSNAEYFSTRGICEVVLGRIYQAAQDCGRAIGLNSEDPNVYRCRAYGYMSVSRYEEAIKDYEKSVYLDSNNPAAYFLLAEAYRKQKNWSKALDNYRAPVLKEWDNPDIFVGMAECYMNLADDDDAREYLNKALVKRPSDMLARLLLSLVDIRSSHLYDGWQNLELSKPRAMPRFIRPVAFLQYPL